MKISLKFILTIVQISLLCYVNAGPKKGRPDALSRTPTKKTYIKYTQKQKQFYSRIKPTKQPIRVRTKSQPPRETYLNSVKTALFCPNNYEFEAVYNALAKEQIKLKPYPSEYIEKIYGTQSTPNLTKLNKQNLVPMYFFKFNEQNICLALCGQRTAEVSSFLSQFTPLFKNLKTVYLFGICGCTNGNPQRSILLSHDYHTLINGVVGQNKKDTKISIGNNLYFDKLSTSLSNDAKNTVKNLYTFFLEKEFGSPIDVCPNLTSELFINFRKAASTINLELNNATVCINTEDFLIVQALNNKCTVITIRAISDYCKKVCTRNSETNIKTACESISKAVPITLEFLAAQSN